MNPDSLLSQLRAQGLAPRKGLGQHYLTDANILAAIVAAAELPPDAAVIEVGPGPGTLTAALLPQTGRLIAIELDDHLAPMLVEHFRDWPAFHLLHADALAITPTQALAETGGPAPYFLIANLPYYITSPLLRHFLEADQPPVRSVLTVQLDVAQRIIAQPPAMSLLAVAVQIYTRPSLVRRLSPGAFIPPPKVSSAVLRLDPHPQPLVPAGKRQAFFALARAGFGQKRKTLRNSLAAGLGLTAQETEAALLAAGLSPQQRAQELSIPDWLRLLEVMPL